MGRQRPAGAVLAAAQAAEERRHPHLIAAGLISRWCHSSLVLAKRQIVGLPGIGKACCAHGWIQRGPGPLPAATASALPLRRRAGALWLCRPLACTRGCCQGLLLGVRHQRGLLLLHGCRLDCRQRAECAHPLLLNHSHWQGLLLLKHGCCQVRGRRGDSHVHQRAATRTGHEDGGWCASPGSLSQCSCIDCSLVRLAVLAGHTAAARRRRIQIPPAAALNTCWGGCFLFPG